jgi:glycosyltransferase involved in cell wall biosynthesis
LIKLIIQIPCYNEEETIGTTLRCLPRELPGVDAIEWLIIDDGSTDRTVEEAVAHGVDHVVRLPSNQGLAKAFMAGLEACLKGGADIIVNTDADNQYSAEDIPKIIEPILSGNAEIVVGARPISDIEHFSLIKKFCQKLGSLVVRLASKTEVRDAPSGFRAISRQAAMRLSVFTEYTYTLETIIQAGQNGMAIASVPISTNEDLRPSRLVKSVPYYIKQSIMTIIRIFMTYRPLQFFAFFGMAFFLTGLIISLRFVYFYLTGNGVGHVQSLLLSILLMGTGFFLIVTALMADLIAMNRKLLEHIRWRVWRLEDYLREVNGYDKFDNDHGVASHKSARSYTVSADRHGLVDNHGAPDIVEPLEDSHGFSEKTTGKMSLRRKK